MQTSISIKQAPASPATPAVTIVGADGVTHTIAIPKTAAQIADLRAQRDELSSQLASASERRDALATELPGAPSDAARLGIEQRVQLLDKRILQLESDIATTGQQLASAPAWLLATRENQPADGSDEIEGMLVGGMMMATVVGVIYAVRKFRGRKNRKAPTPVPMVGESADRLKRLECGMESIAIEIERISEGQRFVTKLMSEPKEPVRLP